MAAEATHAELQSALAVAGANASRTIDAIRAQLSWKSAQILEGRDRRVRVITSHVQYDSVDAMMREGQLAGSTIDNVSDIARHVEYITAQ